MHRDSAAVAGFLLAEEAEMLEELLASAGIESWIEGAVASVLGPVLRGAGGGARLLVHIADAERAREVIAASGLFGGECAGVAAGSVPCEEPSGPAVAARGRKTFLFYPLVVLALVTIGTVVSALLVAR